MKLYKIGKIERGGLGPTSVWTLDFILASLEVSMQILKRGNQAMGRTKGCLTEKSILQ